LIVVGVCVGYMWVCICVLGVVCCACVCVCGEFVFSS